MWEERYAESEYAYGTEPNDFLKEQVTRVVPGRALCLAEGQGRNAVFLASLGFDVTAVDLSPVGLHRARELAAARGVSITTEVLDLAQLHLDAASWDLIVSIFAHVPPPVRAHAHGQVVRGLRAGGRFILEAYTPGQVARSTGGPRSPELTMTLQGLKSELSGLHFDVARELTREVIEGKYHTGLADVVQLSGVR
ncbi:MAG: class I SAM-dependent methyltransferase [Myxococcota bacterium]